MEVKNKVELKIENFEKCCLILDTDCPLGHLYDYTCILQSYVLKKMKELEVKKEDQEVPFEEKGEDQ